jgi:protein SPT2
MEARLSDVEQEEQRAIRIAKREDALAEREERERKARKEREKERDRKGGK